MKNLSKIFILGGGIVTLALTFTMVAGTANAQSSYGTCVTNNRSFGGATAACAPEICTWQACKDRIIKSGGAPGASASGALKGQTDPGAWGTALATCMPDEQIMQSCLKSNVPPPKPKVWCKTGSDDDLELIRRLANSLNAERKRLMSKKTAQYAKAIAIKDEHKAWREVWTPEDNLFDAEEARAEKARSNGNEDAYPAFRTKWVSSGRMAALNRKLAKSRSLRAEFKEAWAQYKIDLAKYEQTRDRYDTIARDMLDRDRDCAGGLAALQ